MSERSQRPTTFRRPTAGGPKAVRLSPDALVGTSLLVPEDRFLWVVEPQTEAFDLGGWIAERLPLIQEKLLEHGGILFRRSGIDSAEAFQRVASIISPDLITYQERAAPRTEVARNVYTFNRVRGRPVDPHAPRDVVFP